MNNKIAGVDIKHLEWLVTIIRDKYSAVKSGVKYLENMEGEYDLTALANIRDFLSHIETSFKHNIHDKEIEANINQAEEHLRRALVEPYHTALDVKLQKFLDEYREYEEAMLPNEAKYGLSEITDHNAIRHDIHRINTFLNEGRKRKGGNLWDNSWEEGVENFVQGYELAIELHNNLKEYKEHYYINKYTYDKNAQQKRMAIFLAIFAMIVGVFFTAIFSGSFQSFIIELLK